MRQFITAAAVAVGIIALWAAILLLIAEPETKRATATSPAMSKALFLYRGRNGLDQGCVGALAKALPPDILRAVVRDAVLREWDGVAYHRVLEQEVADRDHLTTALARLA